MKLNIVVLSMLLATGAEASLLPTQSSYYYQLGGANDVYIPAINRDQVVVLGGNAAMDFGVVNCALFNPVVSITNTLQDLKSSVAGMPDTVISNLKGSVVGFPMYKLQQAMPGLYNILQNGMVSAQNEFALKVADCQRVKQTLEAGNSPLSSMISVSDSQGWIDAARRAAEGTPVDVTQTAKTIANQRDEYGMPWVHRNSGNSGGSGQLPINVINDVVIAGYNLLLNPSRDLDSAAAPKPADGNFVRFWATPAKAGDWAVMVLGDMRVSTKKTPDAHTAKAGIGLSTLLHSCPKLADESTCVATVSTKVWKLVDKQLPLNDANLRTITASNVLITDEIITAIQRMPREQQILTISKLGEEIAIQNLLDEALMLRRLLHAGLQIQEVQNIKAIQDMVQYALKKLDSDIHSLAFEHEVRKEMMTKTLELIMDLRTHNVANSMPGDDKSQPVVKDGAIYRTTDKGGLAQ